MAMGVSYALFLFIFYFVGVAGLGKWCPPPYFMYHKQRRASNAKTAIISQIYGPLVSYTYYTFELPSDEQISRQLYFHLGLLGVDHIYFTTYYNATYPSPSVEDIFPNATSCVRQWFRLGLFTWETVPYLNFTENLQTEGINAMYDKIRPSYDWVIVSDIDELILPTNWNPANPKWCSHERPSVIDLALQQIQYAATSRFLQSFDVMEEFKQKRRSSSDACLLGSALNIEGDTKQPLCTKIGYIVLPVYYWATDLALSSASLSTSRCEFADPYGLRNETIRTKEINGQGQSWKSIHNTKNTPSLSGELTMHLGMGFSILAPRSYHKSGVSLEVAHLRAYDYQWEIKYMITDNRIVNLFNSYEKCLQRLGSDAVPEQIYAAEKKRNSRFIQSKKKYG